MRPTDIAELVRGLAVEVRDYVGQILAPVKVTLADLEKRLQATESASSQPMPGSPGASAFEVACAAGFVGTEQQWLESLRGPPGASVKGDPGEPGQSISLEDVEPLVRNELAAQLAAMPAPKDGQSVTLDDVEPLLRTLVDEAVAMLPIPENGKDGKSVSVDDVWPLIKAAIAAIPPPKDGENVPIEVVSALVAGEVARSVAALPAPAHGRDGRDAAAIEPLPAIDQARSYPRGTWAKHDGGLWLARATTDGMTGWDCIVNGVSAIDVTKEGRTFSVTTRLSDGQAKAVQFFIASLEYKAIWSRESAYERGDVVTWDGSMWHCEADTADDTPGSSQLWRLCVKRGRDGKDGARGLRGERGTNGRDGRDLNGPQF